MHVAVDARLNAYRMGGIAQYTQQLLAAMVSAAPDVRFTVLEHRKQRETLLKAPNVRTRRCWTPPHHRWEQLSLLWELRSLRRSLLHAPDFIAPLRYRGPLVITVHDLAFLRFPEILDAQARRYYGQIAAAVARADGIIAVSYSTKRDIETLLGVPPERIDVIYEAAAPHFRQIDLQQNASRDFNGHALRAGTFALFVGTLEPRKNLTTLLQALAVLRDESRGDVPRLVVAGVRGWLDDPVFEQVKRQHLEEYVTFIGGVEQQELLWLYNASLFYVNPEIYSGFGLPVLEAMQCGTPVIAADTSALPEVVGDAGLLIPPRDVEAWARAIARLWNDEQMRGDLRQRGLEQAARFTWQQAAAETLALYRRVAQ